MARHGWGLLRRGLEGFLWVVMLVGVMVAWIASGLPDTRVLFAPPESASIAVYDVSGTLVAHRGLTYAGDVRLDTLPDHVPLAILAIEDHRFFDHFGLDLPGVGRAVWANVAAGRVVQGGSTITQQLAKNLFLSHERTLRRKVEEAMLALWLEARLSKEEILTLYLNRVYYGAGTHGIDAAAQRYFNKSARELGLGEAALLAGLLKAPSRYAPTNNVTGALDRAELVLKRMEALGYITAAERRLARPATIGLNRAATPNVHYFVDWAVDLLPTYIGRRGEPLVIRTTLDLEMQRAAEAAVAQVLDDPDVRDMKVGQVALVALDTGGAVRAMVGGRSYRNSPFNRATRARRQPGSAFKPFVYLAALDAGWKPTHAVDDRPIRIGRWSPANFTGRFEGKVSLTYALSKSLNAATVRLTETIGRHRVIDMANRVGLDAPLHPHPSLPLGTVEVTPIALTTAYAAFANGGRAIVPNPMVRIETRSSRILYDRESGHLGQAVDPDIMVRFNEMMRQVVATGTGRRAAVEGRAVAGKTGTSQSYRDAWFVGYADGLVAGVWVGNDDGTPMDKVTGGTVPARIWQAFADVALPRAPFVRRIDPPVPDLLLSLIGGREGTDDVAPASIAAPGRAPIR